MPISVPLILFAYLFGWYNASVIILSFVIIMSLYIIIYHYVKFWLCNTNVIFINHHPSCFVSFFQPFFGGEFETLSSSGMVYPYPFLLLLSVLSYAYRPPLVLTPVFIFPLTLFNYDGKGARDIALSCKCHLINIMSLVSSMIDRSRW